MINTLQPTETYAKTILAYSVAIVFAAALTTGIFNGNDDAVTTRVSLYKPIDLEALRGNAAQYVNRVMDYIVDVAKAEAFVCLGYRKEGIKLMEIIRQRNQKFIIKKC